VSWEEDRSIKDAVRLIITELFNWLDRIAAANPKYEHIVKMGTHRVTHCPHSWISV